MSKQFHSKQREPSQRQLRVGEELRHALSTVLLRNEVGEPALDSLSITVSEVRVSPDLRHATAYVSPLGGAADGKEALEVLGRYAGQIRRSVNTRVHLKFSPQFRFKLDESFDYAMKINQLMNDPQVARDIVPQRASSDTGQFADENN